jgi:hypothetical protein
MTWYLQSHFVWLRLSYSSITKLPFVRAVAHEVSAVDDRPKSQISTAAPAEPGGTRNFISFSDVQSLIAGARAL